MPELADIGEVGGIVGLDDRIELVGDDALNTQRTGPPGVPTVR